MFDVRENQIGGAVIGFAAARPASLTERLRSEKQQLEQRLKEINNVLNSLEKNPETQSVLDAVARLGHHIY